MIVTFAWKIDNDLYAYIVNDRYLDNGGNLLPEYDNEESMAEFKGKLYSERLDEKSERKIYLYCQQQWSTHSPAELSSYTECFNSMIDKIHDYEYPSYFYVSLLDAETYFNTDEECSESKTDCCVYTPDGNDVSECNQQKDYTITTKYAVGGIPAGTPLSDLTGLSFSELWNMAFFGDQCGEDILLIEPNPLNVDGINKLYIEPEILNVNGNKE